MKKLSNIDDKDIRLFEVLVPARSTIIVDDDVAERCQNLCSTLGVSPASQEEWMAYQEEVRAKERLERELKEALVEKEEELREETKVAKKVKQPKNKRETL